MILSIALCAWPLLALAEEAFASWTGLQSRVTSATTVVAHSADEWRQVWRDAGREPPRAFSSEGETAAAIFLGRRPSGGFAVEIVNVDRNEDGCVVVYREKTPAPDTSVMQVLTSPWAVIVVPASGAQIEFRNVSAPAGGSDKRRSADRIAR